MHDTILLKEFVIKVLEIPNVFHAFELINSIRYFLSTKKDFHENSSFRMSDLQLIHGIVNESEIKIYDADGIKTMQTIFEDGLFDVYFSYEIKNKILIVRKEIICQDNTLYYKTLIFPTDEITNILNRAIDAIEKELKNFESRFKEYENYTRFSQKLYGKLICLSDYKIFFSQLI